ncbi:hypothetical protein J4N45_11220 [Vibrio sp. SCSIO 43140]|uniref:helicase-related protein n=1 Tax=Vibrio sp. SCSIO 43140 TaxID=2819100 RepID=UPI002075D6F0|nr:helicase-related protein [Vibrio sp. SCSIO 43140]USD59102.1 hypothetical protein J4N45_11220 [Vibrio sp. SCSIO 43140]
MLDIKYIKDTFKLPVWQVLLRLPMDYVDTRCVVDDFRNLTTSDKTVLFGAANNINETYNRTTMLRGTMVDRYNHTCSFSIFAKKDSAKGQEVVSRIGEPTYWYCKTKQVGHDLYINDPQALPSKLIGRLVPTYNVKTKKLKGFAYIDLLEKYVDELIPITAKRIRDELAKLQLDNAKLRRLIDARRLTLEQVLFKVHFPESFEEARECNGILQRIAATLLFSDIEAAPSIDKALSLKKKGDYFNAPIPFTPSDEQDAAVCGVLDAINNKMPKSVLFGDVGTGKTICGAIVVRHVYDAGGVSVILVPNLILGAQIYKEIDSYWPEIGIEFLLSDSEQENFGEKGYRCIKELTPENRVVIGTTALVHHHNDVEIDLLWVDEEQKLGLETKEKTLITEGKTHLLLSSATCIPRTQAMMSFGLIPYFKLTKYHKQREIITRLYDPSQMVKIIDKVQTLIEQGQKVLIISTMKGVNKSENMAHRASAEELYNDWHGLYGDLVRLSHGGLSKQDNENAINAMKSGEAQILIATTLVEVGITVPKLSYAVVLNPENLGVVTLHQIRGRLSREGGIGYFDMLPTKALKQPSLDRLELLVKHADGFTLAEADLALRGMGDLKDGNNQSGTSKCILADQQLSLPLLNSTLERLSMTAA